MQWLTLCPIFRQQRAQLRQNPTFPAPKCLWQSCCFTPRCHTAISLRFKLSLSIKCSWSASLPSTSTRLPLNPTKCSKPLLLLQPKKAVLPLPSLAFLALHHDDWFNCPPSMPPVDTLASFCILFHLPQDWVLHSTTYATNATESNWLESTNVIRLFSLPEQKLK